MGAKDESDTRQGAAEGVRGEPEEGEEDGEEGGCPHQEDPGEKGSRESCCESTRQKSCR